jgi:hypothetical protein
LLATIIPFALALTSQIDRQFPGRIWHPFRLKLISVFADIPEELLSTNFHSALVNIAIKSVHCRRAADFKSRAANRKRWPEYRMRVAMQQLPDTFEIARHFILRFFFAI